MGIVLQIAVHGDHVLAFGVIEARGQRRGLSEVAAQLHHDNPAIDGGNLLQQPKGVVLAAVVDEHQLERLTRSFHYDLQTIVKLGDILLFIMKRDDDGILKHRIFIIPSAPPMPSHSALWMRNSGRQT